MPNWSGSDYREVGELQRTMITEASAALSFAPDAVVLDIGCGDGFLTRSIADAVPAGAVVGVDASPKMIATAQQTVPTPTAGPFYVLADACRLPFAANFDAVVSFNALHWVLDQAAALDQIARVLLAGGRATIQMVCAGERPSLEAVLTEISRLPRWATAFDGFSAPFVHVEPDRFRALADAAGLAVDTLTVADREWDFGSREQFERWCAVGSTAWTDRVPESERAEFIAAAVDAYEPVAGRPGLFRYMQMRAHLTRVAG